MKTISPMREIAYRIDTVLWVRDVLGKEPSAWQAAFLRAGRGASILVLTVRQVCKTTVAAWAVAHCMLFRPGSLSVVACPAQRQSAEAIRKVRDILLKAGAELESDNVYALELANGSRLLALPSSDDTIRGLTVDGWIVVDEASRVNSELIAALRPMRARTKASLAMLSTAWSRTDPFWLAWAGDEQSWIRLKATVDEDPTLLPAAYLDQERRTISEEEYNREFIGIPGAAQVSPFDWELYERATAIHQPLAPPGAAFRPPPVEPAVPISNPFRNLQSKRSVP